MFCCLVTHSCPTLCDPVDCSMPGVPAHQLSPWICSNSWSCCQWYHPSISSSVIPCCPPLLMLLIFPSNRIFSNESALHIRWLKYISTKYKVQYKVHQLQHQSLQWIFRTDFLYDWPVWSPCSPRDSKESAAAAAKSLQSCLTLCDPIDGSPPGSHVPGILQARTLEWIAISLSKYN